MKTQEADLMMVKKYRNSLELVKEQNTEICMAAVQLDASALRYVECQTPEICIAAVQLDASTLRYVECQTPEICMAAVKQNGYALEDVKTQTLEICMEAVKQNGRALEYVKMQTSDICLVAVEQDGYALQYVETQTPKICMTAVQRNGFALEYVKKQTPEVCMEAVKQSGRALMYVLKQTPEICLVAVHQNGWALEFVKEQTFELVMMAMEDSDVDFDVDDNIFSFISKCDLMNELSRLEHSQNKMYQLHDILNLERNSVHLDVSNYDVIFKEKELQASVCTILNEEQHIINLLFENDDLTNDNVIDLIKEATKWNYITTNHELKEYVTRINIFIQDKNNKEVIQYVSTNITNDEYIYVNNSNVVLIDVDPMDLLLFRNEIFQEEEL